MGRPEKGYQRGGLKLNSRIPDCERQTDRLSVDAVKIIERVFFRKNWSAPLRDDLVSELRKVVNREARFSAAAARRRPPADQTDDHADGE